MSVITLFVQDYNIRPRQCHTPRFSREATISVPEHDTYNLRPRAFRVRLQYQAPDNVSYYVFRARLQYQAPNMTPRISDPALFVRGYNNDQKPSNLRQRFIFRAITQPRTFMSRHTSRLKGFI